MRVLETKSLFLWVRWIELLKESGIYLMTNYSFKV